MRASLRPRRDFQAVAALRQNMKAAALGDNGSYFTALDALVLHGWPIDAYTRLTDMALRNPITGAAADLGPVATLVDRQYEVWMRAYTATGDARMSWDQVAAIAWLLTADQNQPRATRLWRTLDTPAHAATFYAARDRATPPVRHALTFMAGFDHTETTTHTEADLLALAALRGYSPAPLHLLDSQVTR